ncbi:DUF6415 family natural product biosynthesis protein [[Kitasatospora] papulosa]|uniref:DUF6415 family natural product biosynthesis protein n=1 Tax=[Kitasatospora] papulosa TaxID=1464011 RepID=UPI0036C11EAD
MRQPVRRDPAPGRHRPRSSRRRGARHVDAYLATALPRGGAIIADGYAARYYALVPASTGRWWHVPDTVCLGSGSYLGVPRPGIEGLDDARSYWSVPMEGPGALCSPTEIQALMRFGQERNGADQRAAGRAVVQSVPLDIQSMRSAAEQACDVESPDSRDLEGTIAALRAYTEVLAPEVKQLATRAPAGDRTAMAALIGVEEGRRRLSARSSTGNLHRVARRAAMSVIVLCTHYENLTRPSVK